MVWVLLVVCVLFVCVLSVCALFKIYGVVLYVCLNSCLISRLSTRECVLCLWFTLRCCMVRVCVLFVFACVSCLSVFVWLVCDVLCGVVWYVVCIVRCLCA